MPFYNISMEFLQYLEILLEQINNFVFVFIHLNYSHAFSKKGDQNFGV